MRRIKYLAYKMLYWIFFNLEKINCILSGVFFGLSIVVRVRVFGQKIDIWRFMESYEYKQGVFGRISNYFMLKMITDVVTTLVNKVILSPEYQITEKGERK